MKTRKINFTVQIDDNDLIEHSLIRFLGDNLGESLMDYKILQDTKDLYESDDRFKVLCKEYKKAKKAKEDYIWSHK